MSTSEFDTQLKSAWGNSSTYCTAYTFFEQGFTAAWNANRNSTQSIRDLANEAAMQLLVDKVNELQKKVDELEKESQWLPMDTAPKDGTEILVLFKRIGAKMVSWTTRDSEPWSEYAHWHVDDGKYDPYPLRGYNEEDEVGWKPQPRVSDDKTN